jgi:hypothetical protein
MCTKEIIRGKRGKSGKNTINYTTYGNNEE